MTRHPLTITPDDSVRRARVLMQQGRVRRLPVVDRRRLVGIVTRGDIERRSPTTAVPQDEQAFEELLDHVTVGGVMTLRPQVTSPDTGLVDVARLMLSRGVGALPVVEYGHLVGILTRRDLIEAFVAQFAPQRSGGLASE